METIAFMFLSFLLGIFLSQNFSAFLTCSIEEAYNKIEHFLSVFSLIGCIYLLFCFIIRFLEQPLSESALAFGLLMTLTVLMVFFLLCLYLSELRERL